MGIHRWRASRPPTAAIAIVVIVTSIVAIPVAEFGRPAVDGEMNRVAYGMTAAMVLAPSLPVDLRAVLPRDTQLPSADSLTVMEPLGAHDSTTIVGLPVGAGWANLTNPSGGAPSPRSIIAEQFAYDPADGYYVLFGGFNSTGYVLNDTWTFRGGLWTELNLAVAPPRLDHASLAWDAKDGYLVLFGGSGVTYAGQNETWKFIHGVWTQLHPSEAPSPRWGAAMTWDPTAGYLVLFGGCSSLVEQNDTWSFVGGAWTNITPSYSPPAREDASVAFDSSTGYLTLFGGQNPDLIPARAFNDTWKFANGAWTNLTSRLAPSPRFGAGLADFPSMGGLVLYGGASESTVINNETWFLRSGTWSRGATIAALPSEALGGFVAGPSLNVIMFGGIEASLNEVNETWEYYAINLTVTASAVGGDAPLDVSFQANSSGGTSTISIDWSFGDGINASGVNSSHVYRAAGNYSVFVQARDGLGVSSNLNFTIDVLPQLLVSASAGPLSGSAPLPVSFDAAAEGGDPPYTFEWSPAPGVTLSGVEVTHTYAIPGAYTATLVVSDSLNVSVEQNLTIEVNASVPSMPALSASASANRTEGEAPLSVQFNASAIGGTSPYSFAWSLGGGASSTLEDPSMRYTSPGTYEISVMAEDADGDHSSAPNLTVLVLPHVSITPTASVTSGTAPLTVAFTSAASGGLGPYAVIWSFGDGGSGSGGNVSHTFTATGTFNVSAEVVDANGVIAHGSVQVAVGPSSGTSGPESPAWYASLTSWAIAGAAVIGLVLGVIVGRLTSRGRKGGGASEPTADHSESDHGPGGSEGS